MSEKEFEKIYKEAHEAGLSALNKTKPTPIRAVQRANLLDDNSPIVMDYGTIPGVCGFAWINVKPGTSRFCRWLKKKGYGDTDGYYGGITIWVRYGGQTLELKEAYARAFADVLRKHNIDAYDMSRID